MIYDGSGNSLGNLEKTVRKTTKALKEHLAEFDAIAVSGMSGVVVGSPVALRIKKPLLIVRKESDDSHHGSGRVINHVAIGKGARVLFLDDFTSSGDTRIYVCSKIEGDWREAKIVAQFLYDDYGAEMEGTDPAGWRLLP